MRGAKAEQQAETVDFFPAQGSDSCCHRGTFVVAKGRDCAPPPPLSIQP